MRSRGRRCRRGTLTVIVPRHPQRFDDGRGFAADARPCRSCGAATTRAVPADVAFVLGDSLGELPGYYAAADVAFVGGSLLPLGGQNLIEADRDGNADARRSAHVQFRGSDGQGGRGGRGAARRRCGCAGAAKRARCSRDPARRDRMRDAALAFHAAHRGAADRLWAWLAPRASPRL